MRTLRSIGVLLLGGTVGLAISIVGIAVVGGLLFGVLRWLPDSVLPAVFLTGMIVLVGVRQWPSDQEAL